MGIIATNSIDSPRATSYEIEVRITATKCSERVMSGRQPPRPPYQRGNSERLSAYCGFNSVGLSGQESRPKGGPFDGDEDNNASSLGLHGSGEVVCCSLNADKEAESPIS